MVVHGLGVEPQRVGTNVGEVEVRDQGFGLPVVLVHPALTNHDLWAGTADALAPEHRVIRVTLPMGAHRIPSSDRTRLVLPNLADALVEVLDHLGVPSAAFVGCDSGGAVVQNVVARRPDRVSGVFLFSCEVFGNFPPWSIRPVTLAMRIPGAWRLLAAYRWTPVQWWGALALVMRRRPDAAFAESCFGPSTRDPRIRRDLGALLASARPAHLRGCTPSFANFLGPVELCWSDGGRLLFPHGDGRRLARCFPDGRFSVIEGCRAFAMLDQPEESVAVLRRFLRERVV